MHTTDYFNTFIAVAPDSAAGAASEPPSKQTPTVAEQTFRLISENPYKFTSDDVIFTVWADRRDIPKSDREDARAEFFSKGQACLRSSDLGKRYGWGVHSDASGRVALYALDSPEYAALERGSTPTGEPVTVLRAMRSSRK